MLERRDMIRCGGGGGGGGGGSGCSSEREGVKAGRFRRQRVSNLCALDKQWCV